MSKLLLKQGLFVKALHYAFQALEISTIYKFPSDRVLVYSTIGECYAELSQFSLASKYYFEGLKISERAGLRYQMAELYTELAWVYKEQLNYDMTLDYLDKSDQINKVIGNVYGIAKNHNIRGLILTLQRKFNLALDEFEKAIQIRESIKDQIGISAIIYNKSLVYEALNELENSLKLQLQSLEVEERVNNKQGLGLSYNSIAALMIKMKRLGEAEKYLRKAWNLSLETQSKTLRRNTALNYSLFYEARGDMANALDFNKRYATLADSLYSESSTTKLAEMEALYQVEKKEQEINRLTDQREIQEKELATQRSLAQQQQFIIIISLLAILLLVIAGFIAYRYILDKNKANAQLKKLNQAIIEQKEEIQAQSEELMEASETISNINKDLESRIETSTSKLKQAYKELDTFFYRSSHDFRRPITTFLGLAGVAKITVKDPVSLELFDKVSETATSLDKMLRKLQSISDLGSQQMIYKEVSVRELVQEVLDGLSDAIHKKGIGVQIEIDEKLPFVSYPALVKIIIDNLIENAIHFAGFDKPFVRVMFSVDNQTARFVVTDNGQGIMTEYQNRIFDMYYRANDRSKGNGLGLYISKKAIEKLEGQIYFTSLSGEGSTFTAEFPTRNL
jgi:signal transduction histidine kinase